jgi:uncharacterized cupredoxin-like copper-binding protein
MDMRLAKMTAVLALGMSLGTVLSAPARADGTVVKVTLWDHGATMEMVTNMTPDGKGDHSKSNMGITLAPDTVPAGEVTFEASNDSKETVHEMLVIPVKDGAWPPVKTAENEINEDTAGALGEVEETEPGKTGSLTLTLAPGKYLLACNIAGHYTNGMWAELTVK